MKFYISALTIKYRLIEFLYATQLSHISIINSVFTIESGIKYILMRRYTLWVILLKASEFQVN